MIDFGKWAFDNKNLVWFLVAVLLVGGLLSAYDMSKFEDPEIKVKTAVVVATRPGASATEMELEVTAPLEEAIRTIDDVESVESWSQNDVAILYVELHPTTRDEHLEQCWDMLRRRVDDAKSTIPDGVSIKVQDDFSLVYGMFYALTGDGYSMQELSSYAKLIQRELTNIDGVGRVMLYGEQQAVINIVLSVEKMASLGVSASEVIATLKGHNDIYYAGYFDNGDNRVRVTVADRFRDAEQIGQMIIQGHEDDQLRLTDIATIANGTLEPARNKLKYNGEEALGIAVAATPGSDILKVGEAVERRLAELSRSHLPASVTCNKVFYQPQRVADALRSFFVNLVESIAIVVVILMFTMGFRSGVIIGFTLLTIVIGSFLPLGMLDGSMQRVSLASFVLAMGMLVDNAIVIVDGILVDLRAGKPRKEALLSIGKKTAMPLLGATLIAILAFLPIFLSPDTAGVYIRDLFIVVAVSLVLSWILALMHVPLMADKWLKKPKAQKSDKQPYNGMVYRVLRKLLNFGLAHRWTMLISGLILIAGSVIGYGHLKQGFFPDMTYDQLYIEYKLPEGTNYTRVERELSEIEAYLKSRDEVVDVITSIGGTPARYNLVRSIATPSLAYGELIVSFTSAESIDRNIVEIQNYLSTNYPDAYVKVKKYNIMYKKYPVEAQIVGRDPAVLNGIAEQIRNEMMQCPEVTLITTDWDDKVPVHVVDYQQSLARRAAVSRGALSMSLLTATGGVPIGIFYEGRNSNIIYLKCEEATGRPIDNMENVPIFALHPNIGALMTEEILLKMRSGAISRREIIGELMKTSPLTELGSGVAIEWEYPVIARYNGQRAQTVMCSPVHGIETGAAQQLIEQRIAQHVELPEGYAIRWGGEKEASSRTLHYLFKNYPLCIVLIIAVLILLFKDYRKPAVILCCVPLLAVGVVGAMLISGKVFNFCAIVGVLGLVGMLIKNCIVLMDEIDAQLRSGKSIHAALVESSCSRLRAVMMASLTTILGMIPLLADDLFGSMAVTIMGGLLFSTLATLVYLPIIYALFFSGAARVDSK